jgi:hypothetical protein
LWKVQKGATTLSVRHGPCAARRRAWLDGKLADAFAGSDTLVTEIIEKAPKRCAAS